MTDCSRFVARYFTIHGHVLLRWYSLRRYEFTECEALPAVVVYSGDCINPAYCASIVLSIPMRDVLDVGDNAGK